MDTFDNINDRTGWPYGEWDDEPDRAIWVHEETGARCTMRRGALGSWCGYVGLGPNHPLAGKDYNDIDAEVHGGLTYAAYCHPLEADEWIRYRLHREAWVTESLLYPQGDAARHLREDRKGDTSTLIGWQEWIRLWQLCHDDCPHGLWWLGYDTAHAWDIVPGMEAMRREAGLRRLPPIAGYEETYKNFQWVFDETNRLVVQLFETKLLSNSGG